MKDDTSRYGKGNLLNPAKRDTFMIEKGLTYIIAVKPDNPGVWALHCHNDIHAVSGMFSQVIERPAELRKSLGSWAASPGTAGSDKDIVFSWWKGTGTADLVGDSGDPTVIASGMYYNIQNAMKAYEWGTGRVGWVQNPN